MVEENTYRLVEPVGSEKLGVWARHLKQYDQVIGFSSLAHVFLRNEQTSEYAVLHPFKAATKSYHKHQSIRAFEEQILNDPSFSEHVLRSQQVEALTNEFGPLDEDEVFIPQPIPIPGVEAETRTYAKGSIWDLMEVLGQLYALGAAQAQKST